MNITSLRERIVGLIPFETLRQRSLKIEKRLRFVIATATLSFLMFFSISFFFDKAAFFIPVFIIFGYALTYFSLLENIEKVEWFMLFLIPVMFTVAFYLFYFLFPARLLTRIILIVFYPPAMYGLFLTSNIFSVGVEKNLQLYRAAFSMNYLSHTIIVFFLASLIFSLRSNVLINLILIALVVYPLSLQLLWSIKLDLFIERQLYVWAGFITFVLVQGAIFLSFIPLRTSISALILAAGYYSVGGLVVAYLDNRLFEKTVREYVIVLAIVIGISLLTLSW